MEEKLIRTMMIYGKEAIESLKGKTVAIFGLGGVGGYVCEALVRSGIDSFVLIDDDKVSTSNLNRQIIATLDTIGKDKVDVMKERILSINKDAKIKIHRLFFLNNEDDIDFEHIDYIVDAIDTITAKINLAVIASKYNIPLISSMGTGNKINPMGFVITDINKTEIDPICKIMRRELKKRNIAKLKVCFSKEKPIKPSFKIEDEHKNIPGSSIFAPACAGLLIASEVIRDLSNNYAREELKRDGK